MNDRNQDLLDIQEMFEALARRGANEWNRGNRTGLSVTHMLILQVLHEHGPCRPTNLANRLQITTGGITGLTNKLVNDGHIRRRPDGQDRRVNILEITESGRGTLNVALDHRNGLIERLFGNLPDSDIRELKRILTIISDQV